MRAPACARAGAAYAISAEGYHRVLQVARTIADLARSDTLDVVHVTEAIAHRPQFVAATE
jgi:magnesium chelatase family protein